MNVTTLVVVSMAVMVTTSFWVVFLKVGPITILSPTCQPDVNATFIVVAPFLAMSKALVQVVLGGFPYRLRCPVTTNTLFPPICSFMLKPGSYLNPINSNVSLPGCGVVLVPAWMDPALTQMPLALMCTSGKIDDIITSPSIIQNPI